MINMHYEVTNLKLLYFLQRQRYLTTAGLVRTQIIFVEAVKYLMVSEDA